MNLGEGEVAPSAVHRESALASVTSFEDAVSIAQPGRRSVDIQSLAKDSVTEWLR